MGFLAPLLLAAAVAQAQPPEAPVVLGDETVFVLHTGIKSIGLEERAAAVSRRLRSFADDPLFHTDELKVVTPEEGGDTTDVVAGETIVTSVHRIDADIEGKDAEAIARARLERIRDSIDAYRRARLPRNLALGGGAALLATIVLVFALRLLGKLYRRVREWVAAASDRRLRSIRFQSYELVGKSRLKTAVLTLLAIGRIGLVVVLVYAWLFGVLEAFPWTRGFAGRVAELLWAPLRRIGGTIVEYVPNFFFIAVVVALTVLALRFLRFVFREIERGAIRFEGFYPEWAIPTYKIARVLVIALALVACYQYIPGSDSLAFKGVSVFLGVLVSLGSSSAIANVVAGVMLTYTRAFKIGDFVRVAGHEGNVVETSLLVTKLRTTKNVQVTLPNSAILSADIQNLSEAARERRLVLPTAVTIGYDAPWRQVHALLKLAAERTRGILSDPEPFVLQTALEDFYVRYELNAYTDGERPFYAVYSDLHANIQDAFNEFGVQILSPNYVADRAIPTVVPKERWHEPPAGPEAL